MLGLRGCRLGIMHPEIYAMQVRAITKAACSLMQQGKDPKPEIMIPLCQREGSSSRRCAASARRCWRMSRLSAAPRSTFRSGR